MAKNFQERWGKQLKGRLFLFPLMFFPAIASSGWAEYPDRPINMIVPYAPGAGGDFGSRIMADRISKFLGQPLISVYKPGGGGSLAWKR